MPVNPPAHPRTPRRLAILNRHFWPISNSSEMEVAWLQTALMTAGCQVDVITIRWQKYWPEKFVFRGGQVYRLPKPMSGPFGKFRSGKALSAHLIKKQYDGLIAFGLGDDACTVVSGFGGSVPVVLRITSAALNGLKSFGKRETETLLMAARILVDGDATRKAILSWVPEVEEKVFIASSCIECDEDLIEDVVQQRSVAPFRSLARQACSRAALSDAHPILQIAPHQPLVVTAMSMDHDRGVCDLVKAWKLIQRRHCMARLWIIGEGKGSKQVWDEILEQDLVYTAIMPGFFDHLSEVFQATDLYIHPARTSLECCVLDAARAHGVCTISTATHDHLLAVANVQSNSEASRGEIRQGIDQSFVHCPKKGLLVPRQSPETLAASVAGVLGDGDFRFRVGSQTRKYFAEKLFHHAQVEPYLKVFETSRLVSTAEFPVSETPS